MDVTRSILFKIRFLRAMLPVMTQMDQSKFEKICSIALKNELTEQDFLELEGLCQKFEKRT
jgi:hypothetical protein